MSTPISSSTSPPASSNALVTSTGIGSGLNIPGIVSSLTTAYGAAENNQLSTQQTSLQSQVSAYGTFASALGTLQATLSALENPSQLAGFSAAVADKTVATATASATAVPGQYSLAVQNLATSATLTSKAVANSSTSIGTGTLTIAVGGHSTAINISSSDNTLGGIANAINTAPNNPGVSASIITTTNGARLVLSGTTTGAANAITVTQSGGDGGLSALVYNPAGGTTNLTQTQAAQDANFTLNGFAATSGNNIVSGAISGVTINLVGASAATTSTTLSVSPDTTAASTSIGTFVTALSGVLSSIQSLTAYDPSSQTAGPLQGNSTIEAFQNQLSQILDAVTSGGAAGGINSLASIGITANTQGTYDTNSNTLSNALSSNLTAVGNLLGGTTGIASKIDTLIGGYTKPGGLLATINQGLQSGLKSVAAEQTQLNAQLATYSATLTTQYNAMDAAVASLKQTQAYLTAEFNPNAASSSSSSSTSLGAGNTNTGG
jgi:flagellar hook-associated protein 2